MTDGPSFFGLIVGGLYVTVFLSSALAGLRNSRNAYFWISIGFLSLILVFIRVSGLQIIFSNLGRTLAIDAGIYASRSIYQSTLMVTLGVILLGAGAILMLRRNRKSGAEAVAAVGIIFLIILNVSRVVSNHRVDEILRLQVGSLNFGLFLEAAALVTVFACSILKLAHRSNRTLPR